MPSLFNSAVHLLNRALIAAVLATSAAAATAPYYFSTLAGSPSVISAGAADGPGYQARFNRPYAIAVDSSGNLFVADNWNRTIRKITPDGTVSTFAGTAGVYGAVDGTGSDARFGNPWALAVDGHGNVFVADSFALTIRKITPDGVVTTLAGKAFVSGYRDGPAGSALFKLPAGIAVDASGTVFVADKDNHAIRKISPDGQVTTLVQHPFQNLQQIDLDPAGNVVVTNGNAISKVSPDGKVTTFAGLAESGDVNDGTGGANWGIADGQGEAARFNGPGGLAVDATGTVFVADTWNNTIRKITSDAAVTTFAGLPAGYPPAEFSTNCSDGQGSHARFFMPNDVAVDRTGNVYVADTHNNAIRKITPSGQVTTLAGLSPFSSVGSADGFGASARFASPHGTAVDGSGNLYVADSYNHTVRKIAPAGAVTTLAGSPGLSGSNDGDGAAARFYYPKGVAADRTGNIYVSDTGNHTVRRITPDGKVTTLAGTAGIAGAVDAAGGAARFNLPQGITVDPDGTLYVADTGNHTIRQITGDGVVTTFAGAAGLSGSMDGVGAAARFFRPEGVAVTPAHEVYVADTGNYLLRRITPNAGVSTLAGSAGSAASIDGVGAAARFIGPAGVAVDASGTAFVVDNGNYQIVQYVYGGALMLANGGTYTIRKVSSDGVVSTIAGQQQGAADGLGTSAQFDLPYGIAVDSAGALYVSCSNLTSNTVRKGVLVTAAPAPAPSRLVNLSTRADCSADNRQSIGGFVVAGHEPKQILIRAVGPSLTAQGLASSEVLPDPVIELHRASGGDAVIARNDDLGDNANSADIAIVTQRVGAAALLTSDRTSSALLVTLDPGIYTFVVSGKSGSAGIVLIEAYDADVTAKASTFVNLSTRAHSTPGNGVTIGGLVISGTVPKRVLLRALGPTLATQGLGQQEVLSDPTIELHDARHGNAVVATNDDWTSNDNVAEMRVVGARIGATPFAASDAKSSAMLLSLQPGIYSFVARGTNASAGIVLVEAYDAD